MLPCVMKTLRTVAITGAAATLMSAALSIPASAVNVTPCGNRTDLVKVWSHDDHGSYVNCFANGGWVGWDYWTDELSTGNNRVNVQDANGDNFTLEKWTDYHPKQSFAMSGFTII